MGKKSTNKQIFLSITYVQYILLGIGNERRETRNNLFAKIIFMCLGWYNWKSAAEQVSNVWQLYHIEKDEVSMNS